MKIQLPCALPDCPTIIERYPSQLGHSTKGRTYQTVYCSPAHRQQGTRAAISAAMTGRTQKPHVRKTPARGDTMVDLVCDYDGVAFQRALSEVNAAKKRGYQGTYCSNTCRRLGHRKWPKQIPCDMCGALHDPHPSNYQHAKHHFCSEACYAAFPRHGTVEIWNPEPVVAAYIAGFVDAEGHIATNQAHSLKLLVSISNTRLQVLESIQSSFPGQCSIQTIKKRIDHHRQGYRLEFWANQASSLLGAIKPYLIVKREQAVIGLAYQELSITEKRHGLIAPDLCQRMTMLKAHELHDSPAPTYRSRKNALAYTAGFIDGDGSIGINKEIRTIQVAIANTHLCVLHFLQTLIAPTRTLTPMKKKKPHHNQAFALSLSDSIAIDAILEIQPFLRLKGEQSDLALQYMSLARQDRKSLGKTMVNRMTIINQRGLTIF